MALISQADLEARLLRNLTSEEISAFSNINNAVQNEVESIIGSGVESVSESTRYYDGGLQHMTIDPCTSITAIKLVDDDQVVTSTYSTTDYTTEPINSTLKRLIRYRPGRFVTGINNLAITAKFSIYEDAKVLNIVKDSILDSLVAEINNSGNISKESIEGYSIEYARSETKQALDRLRYLFPGV